MAIKTIAQFRTESASEIESEKPLYAQVNNERREFTDAEYDQAIEDRAQYKLDEQDNGYVRARQEAYDSFGNQLDQLFWDIDAGKLDKTGAWYKAIKKVKANKEKVKIKKETLERAKENINKKKEVKNKTSSSSSPKKRLSAREKMRAKNVERFGQEHVDKLRAKHADFKKMKKRELSKADFIKKYPKIVCKVQN